MSTIYLNLIAAFTTIGLTYLHKRLSERSPVRDLVREEKTNDKGDIKINA